MHLGQSRVHEIEGDACQGKTKGCRWVGVVQGHVQLRSFLVENCFYVSELRFYTEMRTE